MVSLEPSNMVLVESAGQEVGLGSFLHFSCCRGVCSVWKDRESPCPGTAVHPVV